VGCLYSIGGAGGECPSREKPLETDACVRSTGPQQSRQRSTAGERKTAAFQSPIEFWHPTGRSHSHGDPGKPNNPAWSEPAKAGSERPRYRLQMQRDGTIP
jgi:hypothetical protein